MNAVEHIVEACYRICMKCFTMQDLKIPAGNNRQFDLLAVSLLNGKQYHVESSVTHVPRWCPDTNQLKQFFDRKFRGAPANREGARRDKAKRKTYEPQILEAYRSVGIDPERLNRVWVAWTFKDVTAVPAFLDSYFTETGLHIQVTSLRDEIIPALQKAVATSNYDDEVLRTLSLLKQLESQAQPGPPGGHSLRSCS